MLLLKKISVCRHLRHIRNHTIFVKSRHFYDFSYHIIDGIVCKRNDFLYLRKFDNNYFLTLCPIRVYQRTNIPSFEVTYDILNELIIPPDAIIYDDGQRMPQVSHAIIFSTKIIQKVFSAATNNIIYEPTGVCLISPHFELHNIDFFYDEEDALKVTKDNKNDTPILDKGNRLIDISNLDRNELLEALWKNNSSHVKNLLSKEDFSDYICGRVALTLVGNNLEYCNEYPFIKTNFFSDDTIDPFYYDNDNGKGTFQKVINELRRKK